MATACFTHNTQHPTLVLQSQADVHKFGAFLLDDPEQMEKIVKHLASHLKVPVFCKIRILDTPEKTAALAQVNMLLYVYM